MAKNNVETERIKALVDFFIFCGLDYLIEDEIERIKTKARCVHFCSDKSLTSELLQNVLDDEMFKRIDSGDTVEFLENADEEVLERLEGYNEEVIKLASYYDDEDESEDEE